MPQKVPRHDLKAASTPHTDTSVRVRNVLLQPMVAGISSTAPIAPVPPTAAAWLQLRGGKDPHGWPRRQGVELTGHKPEHGEDCVDSLGPPELAAVGREERLQGRFEVTAALEGREQLEILWIEVPAEVGGVEHAPEAAGVQAVPRAGLPCVADLAPGGAQGAEDVEHGSWCKSPGWGRGEGGASPVIPNNKDPQSSYLEPRDAHARARRGGRLSL